MTTVNTEVKQLLPVSVVLGDFSYVAGTVFGAVGLRFSLKLRWGGEAGRGMLLRTASWSSAEPGIPHGGASALQ